MVKEQDKDTVKRLKMQGAEECPAKASKIGHTLLHRIVIAASA